MPPQPLVEENGQAILPIFLRPRCHECPHGQGKICSGPTTIESLLPPTPREKDGKERLLTCFEPAYTRTLLASFEARRPKRPPKFQTIEGLPSFIPVLCEGMPALELDAKPLFGIHLDDLLLSGGDLAVTSGRDLRRKFGLPTDARICLIASVRDRLQTNLWCRDDIGLVLRRIRRLGFEFVTGASFSVFEYQSRNGQLINQLWNRLTNEICAQHGLPVVPIFCEVIEEDLLSAAKWISERPSIQVVAGLGQGWKTEEDFSGFLRRMKFLKDQVARPLHFLIIGCSAAERIVRLFDALHHVTITNENLALKCMHGESWDPLRLKFVTAPPEMTRAALAKESLEAYSRLCEECAGKFRLAA